MEILDNVADFVRSNLSNKNASFIAQIIERGMTLIGISAGFKQSESYKFSNKITSFALESGAEVSDHIITGPATISQSFIVSAVTFNKFSSVILLSPIIYLLNELRKSKKLVTVLTSHAIYKNMAIQEITAQNKEGVKNVLIFDIVFKEILFSDISSSKVKSSNLLEKMTNTKNKAFNISSSSIKNIGGF